MQTSEKKKSRKLTSADGVLICRPCHDPETKEQRKALAKVLDVEAAHLGVRSAPRRPIPGRDFAPPQPKDRSVSKIAAGNPEMARRFLTTAN